MNCWQLSLNRKCCTVFITIYFLWRIVNSRGIYKHRKFFLYSCLVFIIYNRSIFLASNKSKRCEQNK